ncbi:MAG: aminoacyl-tRNA hydrolase [Micavibrio sp.]|nr:aminoacyl-tRNA hydrolase [Micavibrio sp.]|tara:strand:- start:907 stop:1470 length:564 start_codon:yes stop_codon:yes gene_type:complete
MYLIVGLGNPGDKYKHNRHNIGFMAMDVIADDYGFSPFRAKFQGQISEGRIGGQKVVLLKPETYMNNSGQSVAAAAKFFKIPPENIIIFHDELDLQPGKVRVRLGGGNAGHNGLKSIQAHLGTADTWRVRIGIGHPGDKSRVSGYVLSDFAKDDQSWIERLLPALSKHIDLLLQGKDSDYMSKVVMN